jgi:hypothetical protein
MKKLFCILSILTIVSPVFADDEPVQPQSRTLPTGFDLPNYATGLSSGVATAAYVNGAYDAMNYIKEDRLNDKTLNQGETAQNGDVIHATADYTAAGATNVPAKPFVSTVNATSGVVNIVNTEVSIPVASYSSPTSRAPIWIE